MPRITDLTSASTVALTDTLVLVQGGTTKKCDVSQVKTLSASELTSGTLGTARLPVVPLVNGGTGSTNPTDALAALNAQPALTSASPLAISGGGTGATTAAVALSNIGGITSANVPALVTTQLSAYTLLTASAAFQNSAQVRVLASAQISAITPASIGALATSAASGFATTAQVSPFTTRQSFAANTTTVNPFSFSNTAGQALLTTTTLGAVEWDNQQMYVTSSTPVAGLTRNPIATAMVLINSKTASYTLVLSDAGEMVVVNSASAATVTIPAQATANSNFPVGTQILVMQTGAAQVTIAGAVGVTINSKNGTITSGRYAVVSLIKIATDSWVVAGDATV